jgi:hypothetical protein
LGVAAAGRVRLHLLDDLAVEPSLGIATALSAQAGKLLVLRPAGKGVELEVFTCEKGQKQPPGP